MRNREFALAWLNGERVQTIGVDGEFWTLSPVESETAMPAFGDDEEFRLAPKTVKVRWRVYAMDCPTSGKWTTTADNDKEARDAEADERFGGWLGPWQEAEVEVKE